MRGAFGDVRCVRSRYRATLGEKTYPSGLPGAVASHLKPLCGGLFDAWLKFMLGGIIIG